MFGRMTVLVALVALAACANLTPAGRNARAGGMEAPPEPPPRVATTAPQPARPAPMLPPPSSAPATRAPAAAPALAAPPAAAPVTTTPAPPAAAVVAPPPVAAPSVVAPAADRPPPRRGNDDDVVVPGAVTRQLPPPNGDPRTEAERMQDINSWDRCVTHVQAAFESDPMRPQLQTPEEYCSQSLGMADRTAVPISRQARRPSR